MDGAYGIYVPQRFIQNRDLTNWTGISMTDIEILNVGPEHAYYWEVWDDVLSNVCYTLDGHVWKLSQDGDLWAYCFELMSDEEKINFGMTED